MSTSKKPKIAISGCLLGEEIRFDGQHKRHPHVVQESANLFEFQSFCPEVAMGLGIPRKPVRLVKKGKDVRLVDRADHSIDHTDVAEKTFKGLESTLKGVSGIVLMAKSPSCGYDPIKVYDYKSGMPKEKGRGIWAQHVEDNFPLIPKIDSGRLYDNHLRDTFRTQVLIYERFHKDVKAPKDLVKFQQQYKYYFMQYGAVHMKRLGQICAGISPKNKKEKIQEYGEYLFTTAFKKNITSKHRVNVAEHMAGHLKELLKKSDKRYLHDNIKAFRANKLSFESLITLIGFLVFSYEAEYLLDQKILSLYSISDPR